MKGPRGQPGATPRLSPSIASNPLLRMGRINAAVMPVLATVVCILLVAYHLKDPTQDGQLLRGMEMAGERMDRTQKLRVLEREGVLQLVPAHSAASAVRQWAPSRAGARERQREVGRVKNAQGIMGRRSSAPDRKKWSPQRGQAVEKLLALEQLSLSDAIDIKVPSSGLRGRVAHEWTEEGWVEKRVAPTWTAVAPRGGAVGGRGAKVHSALSSSPKRAALSPAQQAWDDWVKKDLLGEKLDDDTSMRGSGMRAQESISGDKAKIRVEQATQARAQPRPSRAESHTSSSSSRNSNSSRAQGMGGGREKTGGGSHKPRMAKLRLDRASGVVSEGGSLGESAAAPMSVNSFAGRYSDDVPGGAGIPNHEGGESGPFRVNPEGAPGGWVQYQDDEGNDRYYSEHVVGAKAGANSVLNPRSQLLDQGSHENGGSSSGMVEEADRGLLSDQRDHKVRYQGEDGQTHYLRPYGYITSVHKGNRLLCLKNCDASKGERNTPVGVTHSPGPDVWPNTALPMKQQAEADKVEANEGQQDEDEEPSSQVDKETQDIHRALSELRQRAREQSDVGSEDSLAELEKQHEDAESALELAKQVTKDSEYQAYLEYSVHDLQRQLNASETALDLAEKDDFSYIGKLIPGQREGELGWMYQQEDPLLLNSIRRGDFQKGGANESDLVQYQDSRGHPISDEEMEKLTDESSKDIRKIGKKAKDLFDALPLVDSHMMGDDKMHHASTGPPDANGYLDSPVYRPLKRLDRLCLLCESLAGSGELSSVPACAGMSCSRGAWRDSDASTLYDERTLKVALHPPTDELKKKGVLDRARFPEADPEPNDGLGTYVVSETARPAVPMHDIFKAGRTQLAATHSNAGGPAPVSLKATSAFAQVPPSPSRVSTLLARVHSRRHMREGPSAAGKGAAVKVEVGALAQRALGRPLSEEETRSFACEYAATTRVKAHIPVLERLFKSKYHEPLRCTGEERRPLHVLPGAVHASLRLGVKAGSPLVKKAKLQKKWEWSGSWENGTWVPDEPDEEEEEEEEDEAPSEKKEAGDAEEDEEGGKHEDSEEEEGAGAEKGEVAAEDKGGEEEAAGKMQAGEDGPDEDESVYLYVGRDAQPAFQYKMEDILSKQMLHGDAVEVKTFRSISKEAMRAVLWAPDCGVVMFPPFYSFPDFKPEAKRDLRNYVRGGTRYKGTAMFVGGGLEIGVINKLFDFDIHPEYVAGPYYKNERYVTADSSFKGLPTLVPEVGNIYGMALSTLPPNSRSFYDSFGVSVAACVRYDLGRVCFLAQDFLDVLKDEVGPWAELVQALINYE